MNRGGNLRLLFVFFLLFSCASSLREQRNEYIKKLKRPLFYKHILYKGGNGKSFNDAIVVSGAKSEFEGVFAIYKFLELMHGKQGIKWKLVFQRVVFVKNKVYDVLRLQIINPPIELTYFFDITEFFGRFR